MKIRFWLVTILLGILPAPIFANYVVPNELLPHEAIGIFEKAVPGVYIAVGSERGFIQAGLSPFFTKVILVDVDSEIVRFNQINIALLKASKNIEDYRHLRFTADFNTWEVAGQQTLSKSNWEWWMNNVRQGDHRFVLFHRPIQMEKLESGGRVQLFNGVNYLYNLNQFSRIKHLADSDSIQVRQLDLTDGSSVDEFLISEFGNHSQRLSMMDISNAWMHGYLGPSYTIELLQRLKPYADPKTILFFTVPRVLENNRFVGSLNDWDYFGVPFHEIQKRDIHDFVRTRFPHVTPRTVKELRNCTAILNLMADGAMTGKPMTNSAQAK